MTYDSIDSYSFLKAFIYAKMFHLIVGMETFKHFLSILSIHMTNGRFLRRDPESNREQGSYVSIPRFDMSILLKGLFQFQSTEKNSSKVKTLISRLN